MNDVIPANQALFDQYVFQYQSGSKCVAIATAAASYKIIKGERK
jgi:hypothetical protein